MSGKAIAQSAHAGPDTGPGTGAGTGDLQRLRTTDEDAYQSLIERIPGILYVSETGIEGRWLYVSPQVEVLLGWTPQEWMADPGLFARALHPDDHLAEAEAALPGNTMPGERNVTEYRLTARDGRVRWFRDDATLVADHLGRPSTWSGVLTDVTEQQQSAQLLRRSDERSRVIIDTAMDAYFAYDEQGMIRDWNHSAEQLFGWTREEVVGRSLADTVIPSRLSAEYLASIEQTAAAEVDVHRNVERTAARRDGSELAVELSWWRTCEDDGVRSHVFLRDITARKNLQEELVRQAYRDSLTGLANRALFKRRLEKRMADPGLGGFALLLIGLDDIRSVSDSLGHEAADELLKAVAERLRANAPGSQPVARISGDEFALLLADVAAPEEAIRAAESLAAVLRSPTVCAGSEITVRVSIGVRHCAPGAEIGVEELISDAGAAVFTATGRGSRVAVFEDGMRVDRLRRLRLTEALEHAVESAEMSVHYQPYFSFTDGHPSGVEALARWHHPVLGDVSPGEFIGLAESTGQIQAIGLFVLTRACRDIARLREQHPAYRDLTLSVNVSARQLVDGRLQRELRSVLRETGLPGNALMLELTETALVEDAHDVAERLADIRRMGVHLAADDFGTRYASLVYLQRFPIDTLKVDRSFVRRLHQSPQDQLLAGAIITLAKTLGLRTIAEGIEEADHASRLSGLGCDAGQGYLFARPVPLEGLPPALRAGTRRVHDGLLMQQCPHASASSVASSA